MILEIGRKYPEITGPASDRFVKELQEACATSPLFDLTLDFQGTRIISSMAMGTIFSAYQKLKAEGRTMHIINASEKVTHLLRLVNMGEMVQ